MSLFRIIAPPTRPPALPGARVELRAPTLADHAEWRALRAASRAFLEPWEPAWPDDDLTRVGFRQRLRRYAEEMRDDKAYPFFIFRKEDGALVGGLTLSNVRRGVAQACSLGYWAGAAFAGRGYVADAARVALRFAFSDLRLRRVEAACLPDNAASIRVLMRVGFQREGYARGYLQIAGVWRDHLLFAMLADDPIPPARADASAAPALDPAPVPELAPGFHALPAPQLADTAPGGPWRLAPGPDS